MLKTIIKNGHVICPSQGLDGVMDIIVEDSRIAAIGENLATPADAQIFDAEGKTVAPGFVDLHAHLREPGQEAKEDFETGSRAAAAGGFTSVACMPNTRPPVDGSIAVNGLKERARQVAIVNMLIVGAVSKGQDGKELAEIGDMLLNGAVALSDDGHFVHNAKVMQNALDYTAMYQKPIMSHAEEQALVEDGYMHEGAVSTMLGMHGRPSVAEDIAVARDVLLAEYTGGHVHISHVSTKGAVEIIRQAKAKGVKVTAEVTPHHLALTDEAVMGFDSATKVNPPLRSMDHVVVLRQALQEGVIDAIATDHSPHAFEEKDREFKYAPSGFTGFETALGVVLTTLYHEGNMKLPEIVAAMTSRPAQVLGLDCGTLRVGRDADIVIFDPQAEWTVDSRRFYSRGKHTPFEGKSLKGRVMATLVGGNLVYQDGEVLV